MKTSWEDKLEEIIDDSNNGYIEDFNKEKAVDKIMEFIRAVVKEEKRVLLKKLLAENLEALNRRLERDSKK